MTGVLFQAGALAMGAYLSTNVLSSFYGAAGSVLAIMLWAYYTVQTLLYGGEVCREHSRVIEAEEKKFLPDGDKKKDAH